MRIYLLFLITFLVLSFTLHEVNAKTNTKQKDVATKNTKETSKKPSKNSEVDNQEKQEEKPAFEKARIRYTKPKTDNRVKEETRKTKEKQDVKSSPGKKQKNIDVAREEKNKYKQPQDQVPKTKKNKKQEKYSKPADANGELQENVVTDRKGAKEKRTKRDAPKIAEKEKLKKVQREEVGVEEQSEEVCPPCDCNIRDDNVEQYLSNNAEEEVSEIVEIETEEQTQDEENEADENLQCDSLVEGCDV